MPDLKLQSLVARQARLGYTQEEIEQQTGDFVDYPDDNLNQIFSDNQASPEICYLCKCAIGSQNVNIDGAITFLGLRVDGGWNVLNNEAVFIGAPDKVRVYVQISQSIGQGVNIQRAAPVVNLLKGGQLVSRSASGYIRDATDHEQSSNSIVYIDHAPGVDPVYSLQAVRDSTNAGVVTSDPVSSVSFEAVV